MEGSKTWEVSSPCDARITKFPLIGLGWEGRQCWGVEAVSRQVEFECFGYGSEGEPGGGEMEGRAVAEE
jgi:hypothetical protein